MTAMSCCAVLLSCWWMPGPVPAPGRLSDSMCTTQPPQQAHPASCSTHPQSRQHCQLLVRCRLPTPRCVFCEAVEAGVAPLVERALSRALGTYKSGHVLRLLGAHKLQGARHSKHISVATRNEASRMSSRHVSGCAFPGCMPVDRHAAACKSQAQVCHASTHVHAGTHVHV